MIILDVKISVIVPVYNIEIYLNRCLNSIINQTFKDIEIIVVDDGSTDNSSNICKQFAEIDNRIKIIHKENNGLGLARNSGLDISIGDFVTFIDGDDYIENNALQLLYETATKQNCDIVYGGVYYDYKNKIIKKNNVNSLKVWNSENKIKLFLLGLIGTMPESTKNTEYEVSVWKSLYRKDIFDRYNISFVSEREFISEDIIFDIDYIQHTNKIAMIPECIYHYCINDNSLSKIYRKDRFDKNIILYNELNRKLSYIFKEYEYQIRMDRFLITKARICINAIYNSNDKDKKDSIIKILNNKQIEEILARYDINRLPKKLSIFVKAMKNKNVFLIRLLLFIKNILGS